MGDGLAECCVCSDRGPAHGAAAREERGGDRPTEGQPCETVTPGPAQVEEQLELWRETAEGAIAAEEVPAAAAPPCHTAPLEQCRHNVLPTPVTVCLLQLAKQKLADAKANWLEEKKSQQTVSCTC